jgi:hypothetical protein
VFESRTWYKEALILVVIAPFVGSMFFYIFIPLPYSFILYFALLITIAIWRMSKKALSGREAITIILLPTGFHIVTNLFIPWPYSIVTSVSMTFLIIWILHKKGIND